jgi:hypothetical protein
MPLTEKGEEIKSSMEDQYGKEKGEQVFYASKNKGTITGVDEYVSVDNAATAVAGAMDEPPPQQDLPSQEDPNTVPDTEGEGDPEGAGKAVFSNMPWPGRHL